MPTSSLLSSVSKPSVSARFSFRSYQREDLARSAIHDGAIIAWDPGLGKTMAMFAWPYLKRASRVLIVAPAALHEQIISEGRRHFRTEVTSIPDQATAYALLRSGKLTSLASQIADRGSQIEDANAQRNSSLHPQSTIHNPLSEKTEAMPTFFLTDYRWLGYNGGDEWAAGEADGIPVTDIQRRRRIAVIARYFGIAQETVTLYDASLVRAKSGTACAILGVAPDAPRSTVKAAYRALARLTHPDLHPEDPKATERMQILNNALESMLKGDASAIVKGLDDEVAEARPTIDSLMSGIGHTREIVDRRSQMEDTEKREAPLHPQSTIHNPQSHTIKCLFEPTLSTIIADCFDCVVADEAVRLKSGEDSFIATGVLNMRSKYRLALTGTPIKNRLPDVFHLASWVCGNHAEATARWPYGNTSAHRSAFAANHLVIEENITKSDASRKAGNFRRYIKQTNKLTNIHRLWKLLGPVIARRRKDQIGNDIVGKIIQPIRVLPGTAQQRTYQWHLANPPECKTPVAAIGAQLQCLRQAALCPWSASLHRPGQAYSKSAIKWSPKVLAILHLAADLMARGEQLVIFSPFQEFSSTIKAALDDASVPSLLLDGRVKNTRRGELAAEFKARKYPVLIAGIEAMGEGHSFECAAHLVMPSLSWAYDANRQAIDRVHRLTSRKDVTIYLMITQNSIDERLAAIFQEKGDASDLALDGRLFEEDKKEVSLADLIRSATLDFDPHATTIPEESSATEWDTTLRCRLKSAFLFFRGSGVSPAASPLPSTNHSPRKPTLPLITAHCSPGTQTQPDFLNLMTPNPPTSTIKNPQSPIINPSSSSAPSNILPFPTKPVKKPAITPTQAKSLLSTL
jgi:superfamily II DNA or RNA helicase